jgi:hypothetical protein
MQQLLTPKDTAKLLGVQVETLSVWRCTKRYPLKFIKVGSRIRYRLADIEEFIKGCARGSHSRADGSQPATPAA